jgi:hypothetical protein
MLGTELGLLLILLEVRSEMYFKFHLCLIDLNSAPAV